ncbi:MAG TPA: SIS domain-containing protein [Phycisphaerae bacterium]|nr:SIS domain-containing protein [Phycisphaerae bacterium]
MIDEINRLFEESAAVVGQARQRLAGRIAAAAEILIGSCRSGGGVLLFGNGGSAADAQHIAGELVGRFLAERRPFKAEALSTDTSVLTALANDYGYESIFARQIEAKGGAGDVAVALSTSGNSPSVVAGLAKARELGMKTIALTGAGGGKCAKFADVLLDVPARSSPRIQEAHAVIYHILCELVEREAAKA